MGVNQVNGTEMFQAELQNGRIGVEPLLFTQFPVATMATTFSATNSVTDSAAAGTALATGKKTYNHAISVNEEKNAIQTVAEKAKKAGADETVFYRPGGRVTECAHSNCHIIKDGKLITAPTDNLILPGIARAHLIRMCKKLEIPVSETPYTLDEMYNADEVLVTSSSNLCLHANELDGRPVGGKAPELLEKIRAALIDEFTEATAI